MEKSQDLKVALVHDFLTQYGGAERVLEVLSEMYPDAPIYTLLYDNEKMRGKFQDRKIIPSFLQKFPQFFRKRYKFLLPLMPIAPETFDLRDYDLVISSTGAWSKGIVTRLNTTHISYFHSPMRFVWDASGEYLSEQKKNFLTNFIVRGILNHIRIWDKVAADRPDYIISNSKYTQERVRKYYGKDSEVIYPPVEIKQYPPRPLAGEDVSKGQERGNSLVSIPHPASGHLLPGGEGDIERYFLIVSRLSPYKKVDVVVEAFNKLELPLVVVGEGEQKKYLERIANKNIKIIGWRSDEEVEKLFQNARAFIFPCVDDFGIAPVEAMGHGVPVIALRQGGVLETVIEGKTGEFFDAATPEVIADGVRRFVENEEGYDREFIRQRAEDFSKDRFIIKMQEFINKKISNI